MAGYPPPHAWRHLIGFPYRHPGVDKRTRNRGQRPPSLDTAAVAALAKDLDFSKIPIKPSALDNTRHSTRQTRLRGRRARSRIPSMVPPTARRRFFLNTTHHRWCYSSVELGMSFPSWPLIISYHSTQLRTPGSLRKAILTRNR